MSQEISVTHLRVWKCWTTFLEMRQMSELSRNFEYIANPGVFLPQQTYPAGTHLYAQGSNPIEVYWIIEGLIKMVASGEDGEEVIVSQHSGGSLIGLPCAILESAYPATAITLSSTTIRRADSNRFLNAMENDPKLLWHALRLGCAEIHKLVEHMIIMTSCPAGKRLELFLSDLIAAGQYERVKTGLRLLVPLSQREISQWLSVTPEYLSRLIGGLQKERIIRRVDGWIVVLDPRRLHCRKKA
jgi:CRP-like cAMP-binding protein